MTLENINQRKHYVEGILGETESSKLVDKLLHYYKKALYSNQPVLSEFLNPGQRAVLKILVGSDISFQEFGGYPAAEKKRVLLSEGASYSLDAFQISICQIVYPKKFVQLNHSMILGSLANSGIKTETFGDIITDNHGNWQFMADNKLLPFFKSELQYIGKTKVSIKQLPQTRVLVPADDSKMASVIVASLRLDALLLAISKLSRSQIKAAVSAKLVKLNWFTVTETNLMLQRDDVLSLRKFGRLQITDIGQTKKGKYKVVLKFWQAKKYK